MIEKVYIAPFLKEDTDDDGNVISVYDTPFSIDRVSLNAMNGDYEVQVFGNKVKRMCRCMPDRKRYLGRIKEGDAAYLYGATPEGETVNGDNANYHVVAVLPKGVKMMVYFELNTDGV